MDMAGRSCTLHAGCVPCINDGVKADMTYDSHARYAMRMLRPYRHVRCMALTTCNRVHTWCRRLNSAWRGISLC